jgi:hypothetical protein
VYRVRTLEKHPVQAERLEVDVMINKLRRFLRNWLLKDEIKELKDVISYQKQAKEFVEEARKLYFSASGSLSVANEMVSRCLDVSVDVGIKQPSWAVICVKGKPETIRFMELSGNSAQELRVFLRHFQYSNVILDSPFSKEFFRL